MRKKINKVLRAKLRKKSLPLCERDGKIMVCSHNITDSDCPYLRVDDRFGNVKYLCACNVVFLNLFENE